MAIANWRVCAVWAAMPLLALTVSAAQAKPVKPLRTPSNIRAAIDIRNTSSADDDYVTWAPAPATLKVYIPYAKGKARRAPRGGLTIYLTNADAAADGHGHVNFATDADSYRKAIDAGSPSLDQLALTVPLGHTVSFVVAGAFHYFSTSDKDTTIVAHLNSPVGPVIGSQKLMVRVRRSLDTLTDPERNRYLWAMAKLRFRMAQTPTGNSYFDLLVAMHDLGAKGSPDDPLNIKPTDYPDQEHKGSAFLTWHRAFLLEMERALQKIDPSVTLPYWPIYRTPTATTVSAVFSRDFTGSNSVTPSGDPTQQSPFTVAEPTDFAPGNPLYGWYLPDRGVLTRWTNNRLLVHFLRPGDLIAPIDPAKNPDQDSFYFATNSIESDPHNVGHGWSGPWMSNCRISPSDPLFWPFHSYFDWLWAAWQQSYGRYARDGKNEKNFWPNDAFTTPQQARQQPIGHHLFDTMWPWNGATTNPSNPPDIVMRRPPSAPGGPFPASGMSGVWPQQDATPTSADMIDYQGYANSGDDTNVGYDTIPWSPAQSMPPFPDDMRPLPGALADFLDASKPAEARLAASERVDPAQASKPDAVAAVRAIVEARRTPAALKVAGLRILERVDTAAAVASAAAIAKGAKDPALVREVHTALGLRMFARPTAALPPSDLVAPAFTNDQRATDYGNMRDAVLDPGSAGGVATMAVAQLGAFLAKPQQAQEFPPQDAIDFLIASNYLQLPSGGGAMGGMAMGGAKDNPPPPPDAVRAVLRKILQLDPATPVDAGVNLWQAKGLASFALMSDTDPVSIALIQALIRDSRAPVDARGMALLALSHTGGAIFAGTAKEIAGNAGLSDDLRARAAAAVGAYVLNNAGTLPKAELAALAAEVQPWTGAGNPAGLAQAAQTAATLIAYSAAQMERKP